MLDQCHWANVYGVFWECEAPSISADAINFSLASCLQTAGDGGVDINPGFVPIWISESGKEGSAPN